MNRSIHNEKSYDDHMREREIEEENDSRVESKNALEKVRRMRANPRIRDRLNLLAAKKIESEIGENFSEESGNGNRNADGFYYLLTVVQFVVLCRINVSYFSGLLG